MAKKSTSEKLKNDYPITEDVKSDVVEQTSELDTESDVLKEPNQLEDESELEEITDEEFNEIIGEMDDIEVDIPYPNKIVLLRKAVLATQAAGRSDTCITLILKAGKEITDPDLIKQIVDADLPYEVGY